MYAQVGRTEPAIDALQRALELAPEASDAWDTHRVLAVLCDQVGQSDLALAHAYEALTRAPEEKRAALQELVTQLQSTLEKDAP